MEKKKIVAIVQAHMSSSRLPGKVMKDLCGMPALYRMVERLRWSKHVDEVVVAISRLSCDDVLEECCKEWGVATFRGNDRDVLARFGGAAEAYPADAYVRLTSDCPAIDFEELDNVIETFWEKDYRFVSVELETHVPGCWSYEVFTAELLQETLANATEGYEREHVAPYMYTRQPSYYRRPCPFDGSKYRVTLDNPEDYEVLKRIFEALYPQNKKFTTRDVVDYLDAHPELIALNANGPTKHFTQCSYDSFEDKE